MRYLLKMTDSVGTEEIRVFHTFEEAKKGFINVLAEWAPEDAALVEKRFFGDEPSVSIDTCEDIVIDGDFDFNYEFHVKRDDDAHKLEFIMCSTPNGGCGCGCGSSYEIAAQIISVY